MIIQNYDSATIFIHFVQCHPFSSTITNIFTHFLFIYVIYFQLFSSMTTSIMIAISSFTTTYSIISILCILNCCQIFSCPSPWHHLDATIIIIIILCDPLLPEKNQRMHPCTWWPLDILFRISIVNSWCCCWLWWWCWLLMISAIIFLNLWRKSRSPTSTCKMTKWRKLKINLTQKPRRRNNLTPWKLGTRENNGLPYGPYELPSVAMNWSWSMYWPLRPCWRIIRKQEIDQDCGLGNRLFIMDWAFFCEHCG